MSAPKPSVAERLSAMRWDGVDHTALHLTAEQADALIVWVRETESAAKCGSCGTRSECDPQYCIFAAFAKTLETR